MDGTCDNLAATAATASDEQSTEVGLPTTSRNQITDKLLRHLIEQLFQPYKSKSFEKIVKMTEQCTLEDNILKYKTAKQLLVRGLRGGRIEVTWDKTTEYQVFDKITMRVTFKLNGDLVKRETRRFSERSLIAQLPIKDAIYDITACASGKETIDGKSYILRFSTACSDDAQFATKNSCYNLSSPIKLVFSGKDSNVEVSVQDLQNNVDTLLELGCKKQLVKVVYRNKYKRYFDEILSKDKGIMKPYTMINCGRLHCGHKRPLFTSHIFGLFFATNTDRRNGEPPDHSIYGDTRIIIPATRLVNTKHNYYFGDFYCCDTDTRPKRNHFLRIFATIPGTETDKYCFKRLPKLNLHHNKYLWIDEDDGSIYVNVSKELNLYTHIYYCDSIDVRQELKQREEQAAAKEEQAAAKEEQAAAKEEQATAKEEQAAAKEEQAAPSQDQAAPKGEKGEEQGVNKGEQNTTQAGSIVEGMRLMRHKAHSTSSSQHCSICQK